VQTKKTIHRLEYRSIVDWLVSKRQLAGLTQEQLARKLNRPQSFVSKIENRERRLDVVEFIELCKELKTSAKEIIDKLQLGIK